MCSPASANWSDSGVASSACTSSRSRSSSSSSSSRAPDSDSESCSSTISASSSSKRLLRLDKVRLAVTAAAAHAQLHHQQQQQQHQQRRMSAVLLPPPPDGNSSTSSSSSSSCCSASEGDADGDDDDDVLTQAARSPASSSDSEDDFVEVRVDSDSGHESATDLDNDDDDSDSEDDLGVCTPARNARRIRRWLQAQADRKRKIAEEDCYYQENKEKLWASGSSLQDLSTCNFDPYPSLERESFRFAGERDRLGRPGGRGAAYFPNGRKFVGGFKRGIREGPGELFEREGGRILSGNYQNDRLQGYCEIATNEGGVLEMTFERGVAHGPARRFSPDGALQWSGRYRCGVPFGLCWRSNDGEGWYVGGCNRSGRMTGEGVVYLYPDLTTALVGRWENDCMRLGHLTSVVRLTTSEGFLLPEVAAPDTTTAATATASGTDPESSSTSFSLDVSGYSVISRRPLLRDPYERSRVRVRRSLVPGGGEGLFARRDLPRGAVASFYNGVRFHDCHAFNDWDHNSYKIRLNERRKQILDIPAEDRDVRKYRATLAHKINHSFFPNARFADFAHPRFGRILCVKTTRRVRKGEELTCNYGYNLSDCPKWYKDLHDSLFFDGQATIPDEAT